MLASSRSPAAPTAWVLGLAGLIPFVSAAAILVVGPPALGGPALLALTVYAAVILSFLGGVRWGAELSAERPRALVIAASVAPALAGWALLVAPSPQAVQLGGYALALAVQWLWDVRDADLPRWYRALRHPLTAGAVASLLVGLYALAR